MSKYTATIGTRNTLMLSTTLCLHLGCLSCKTRTTFFVSEMDIKFRIMMSIKTILGCIHAIQKYLSFYRLPSFFSRSYWSPFIWWFEQQEEQINLFILVPDSECGLRLSLTRWGCYSTKRIIWKERKDVQNSTQRYLSQIS